MFRIDVATATGSIPTPAAAGTGGYFTNGNPGLSQPATIVDQDWLNSVQEELVAIATATGTALSKTTRTQALTAIQQMIQRASVNFANDTGAANAYVGTYTPAVASYTDGMVLRLYIANANTGASTFNGGGGALSVLRADGSALVAGDIPAASTASFQYKSSTNNFRLLSVTQAFSANAVQQQTGNYAAASGTNTITATFSPAVASHVVGMPLRIKIANNNTSTVTFNPGPGAVAVVTPQGGALQPDALVAGEIVELKYDGTNYQLTGKFTPSGRVSSAASGPVTVTTGDSGAVFRFSGLSADVTLNLPALSSVSGDFEITIINDDPPPTGAGGVWGVIVDGNSSEQIDGQTTRKGFANTNVTIKKDTASGMWRTKSGHWFVYTAAQTIANGSAATIAHGQPRAPRRVWGYYMCINADGGWAAGDIVANGNDSNTASIIGDCVGANATNLYYVIGSQGARRLLNRTTGAVASISDTNWQFIVAAEFG